MARTKVKKKRGSFFSPLISITLVLFLTAIFGMIVLYADRLKSYLKENVQVNVFFDDDSKEADIFWLQKKLEGRSSIISTEYINKEEALEEMENIYGENISDVLGHSPFPASLGIYFKADHAEVDSIEQFKEELNAYPFVKDISYQRVILENIDKNVRKVGLFLLSFMLMFLLIAIVLINNTIRLSMYSQRFLIKTQQLVGATKSFIIKPYISKAIIYGLAGGIIANLVVIFALISVDSKYHIEALNDFKTNISISIFILIFGVLITGLSSYYSVSKYLKLKLDDLY